MRLSHVMGSLLGEESGGGGEPGVGDGGPVARAYVEALEAVPLALAENAGANPRSP